LFAAPEKSLEFTSSKPDSDAVNLTCRARGVYPEPKMALYKDPDRWDLRRYVMWRRNTFICDCTMLRTEAVQ